MFFLLPLRVNVLFPRVPTANYCIIILCTFCFILQQSGLISEQAYGYLLNNSWSNILGFFTSAFLHADWAHFIFNMLYLWIFGNAVNSKLGNKKYLILYTAATLTSSLGHLILSDVPALGASGAINGVIGFYFALYLNNYITIFWFFFFIYLRFGIKEVSSKWIIIFWLLSDIIGAYFGWGNTAYGAHLGGFVGGFILAILFLKQHWVDFSKKDNNHIIERFVGRFEVDKMTPEMFERIKELPQDKMIEWATADGEEQEAVDAAKFYRLVQTKGIKADDLIYCEEVNDWLELTVFFGKNKGQIQGSSKKLNDLSSKVKQVKEKLPQVRQTTLTERILNSQESSLKIAVDDKIFGPFNVQKLAQIIDEGRVDKNDLVFDEKAQSWQKIKHYFKA